METKVAVTEQQLTDETVVNTAPAATEAGEQTPAEAASSQEVAQSNGGVVVPNGIEVEVDGVVATTVEDKTTAIRSHIRCAILKQFGVVEVNKIPVNSGKLYMNNNRTRMKLPAVKTNTDGTFAESLREYAVRSMPQISLWLKQSYQNAAISQELMETIF